MLSSVVATAGLSFRIWKKNSSKIKTQGKNSRNLSKNSIYRKFSIRHYIQYLYKIIKCQFSTTFSPKNSEFSPITQGLFGKSLRFFQKLKHFWKNSRYFGKKLIYRKIYFPMVPYNVRNDKPELQVTYPDQTLAWVLSSKWTVISKAPLRGFSSLMTVSRSSAQRSAVSESIATDSRALRPNTCQDLQCSTSTCKM